MEGINKEKLQKKNGGEEVSSPEQADLLDVLLDYCEELNPWQPIETAPKNETVILLAFANSPPCAAFWSHVRRRWHLFTTYRIDEPTHWQELPEGPK